jgi:hypothetical protein
LPRSALEADVVVAIVAATIPPQPVATSRKKNYPIENYHSM